MSESTEEERVVPRITEKQAKRLNTPISAMVISMIALVGITLPFLWLQPRPDNQSYRPEVNLTETAQEASQTAGYEVLAPELPEGWHVNFARWNPASADAVPFWEFGAVTPSSGFITVTQTNQPNPTWISERIDKAPATGTTEQAGISWEKHVETDKKTGETTESSIGHIGGTTVIVSGQGNHEEFSAMINAVAEGSPSGSSATPATGR